MIGMNQEELFEKLYQEMRKRKSIRLLKKDVKKLLDAGLFEEFQIKWLPKRMLERNENPSSRFFGREPWYEEEIE